MNRKIDGAGALILFLTLCFAGSLAAFKSLPLAMLMTYAAGVLARMAYVKWFKARVERRAVKRARLRQARALVSSWAYAPDADKALEYLSEACDMSGADIVLLARHASSRPLDASGLLDAWRSFKGRDILVIAVTADVEAKAMEVSLELTSPKVRLLDAEALARAIADSAQEIPRVNVPRKKRLVNFKIEKKKAPRIALCALSTLLVYTVTGKIIYLLSASTMLFFAGAAFIRKPSR